MDLGSTSRWKATDCSCCGLRGRIKRAAKGVTDKARSRVVQLRHLPESLNRTRASEQFGSSHRDLHRLQEEDNAYAPISAHGLDLPPGIIVGGS